MSHPQKKRPSSNELIKLHSRARVIVATRVDPLVAKFTGRRELNRTDALAQVARY